MGVNEEKLTRSEMCQGVKDNIPDRGPISISILVLRFNSNGHLITRLFILTWASDIGTYWAN